MSGVELMAKYYKVFRFGKRITSREFKNSIDAITYYDQLCKRDASKNVHSDIELVFIDTNASPISKAIFSNHRLAATGAYRNVAYNE